MEWRRCNTGLTVGDMSASADRYLCVHDDDTGLPVGPRLGFKFGENNTRDKWPAFFREQLRASPPVTSCTWVPTRQSMAISRPSKPSTFGSAILKFRLATQPISTTVTTEDLNVRAQPAAPVNSTAENSLEESRS